MVFELNSDTGALAHGLDQWRLRLGDTNLAKVSLADGIETIYVMMAACSFSMALIFVVVTLLLIIFREELVASVPSGDAHARQ